MKFKTVKVSDIAEVTAGGTPSTKNNAYWDGDIPWITPKDLASYQYRCITSGERNISNEGLIRSSAKLLPENTVLLTSRAPIGYVAIAKNPISTNQGFKNLICDVTQVNNEFLYYFLKSNTTLLENHSSGATFKELSASRLRNINIVIPESIDVQAKIASTLSAYDDLIENNLKRIKLLEEAAQLLYRKWFVDFKFPGYEKTKFINDIPKGWQIKTMDDVCQSVGGGTPSIKVPQYWDNGTVTWVIPSDITKNNCLILLDSEKKISQEGLRHSSAKMLPPDTILMTSRASVGFFGLIDKEVCTNQGFISVIPNKNYMRMYLLFNLMNRRGEILSKAGGATYKEINKSTFRGLKILLPDEDILKRFNPLTYEYLKQARILKKQNHRLKEARDILLPRLMDGSIEV